MQGGIFGPLIQVVLMLGQALGYLIGSIIGGIISLFQKEPELPEPPERHSREADFADHEELKRRGIIDER